MLELFLLGTPHWHWYFFNTGKINIYLVETLKHYNSDVWSTFTLITAAGASCWTEVPPEPSTLLPGLGLLQADHVDEAALLLSDPASRALPSLTEDSKVPGTGRVLCWVVCRAASQAITPVTNQGFASTVYLIGSVWNESNHQYNYLCSAPEGLHSSSLCASIVGFFLVDERKLAWPLSIRHTRISIHGI